MKNLSISLMMINHNREEYIEDAINSVIKQTSEKWELIIVDDFSSDDSIEKIKKYLKDKRIKLIKNQKRLGIVKNRIKCINESKFNIIGIIDSDDILDKKAVETMLKYHEQYDDGLIYSQMMICDKDLNNTRIGENKNITTKGGNLIQNSISHFVTFKKDVYKKTDGYSTTFNRCAEDKDLFYKMEEVSNVLFVNKTLYYYRMNPKSISSYGIKKIIGKFLHLVAKINAYQRRKKVNSVKKIPFQKIFFNK